MTIGTCDVCGAKDVELYRADCYGIETWHCEKCVVNHMRRQIVRDTRHALDVGRMFERIFK